MPDKRVTELTAIDAVTGVDLVMVIDDPSGTPLNKKATVTQLLVNTARTNVSNTFTGDQTVDGDLFVTGEVNPAIFARQKPKIDQFTGTVGDPSGSRTVMSRNLASGLSIRHDDALAHGRVAVGNYDTQIYQPLLFEVESFQVHTGVSPGTREERLRVHPSGGMTVGADHTVDPGGGVVVVAALDLKEGIPLDPPLATGRLYALDVNGYTQIEMRDGAANVVRFASDNVIIAKVSDVAITRGQSVYISGAAGANPLVGLARADNMATMPSIGLALDSGAVNAFIRILVAGTMQLLNTAAFSEGARLYVSPTIAGGMTTTPPVAPNVPQRVGFVTRSHAAQGEVLVMTTAVAVATLHHATHEPGGSDALTALSADILTTGTLPFARVAVSAASVILGRGASGAGAMEELTLGTGLTMSGTTLNLPTTLAYKDQANVFTADQEIGKAVPRLELRDTSGSVNARLWRIEASSGNLAIKPRTDAGAYQADGVSFNRNGTADFYGIPTFAADAKFNNNVGVGGVVQLGSTTLPSVAYPALRSGVPGPKVDVVTGTQSGFVPIECKYVIANGAGSTLLDLTVQGGTTLQSSVAVTGTLTASGGLGTTALNATNLTTGAVPFARVAVSAGSKLLGRGASGAGAMEELTLGTGLTMTGTTLSAEGGGALPGNLAYTDAANVFTQSQSIRVAGSAFLELRDTTASVDNRSWQMYAGSGILGIYPVDDAGEEQATMVQFFRTGTTEWYSGVTYYSTARFYDTVTLTGQLMLPASANPAIRFGTDNTRGAIRTHFPSGPGVDIVSADTPSSVYAPLYCSAVVGNAAGSSLVDLTVSGAMALNGAINAGGTLLLRGGGGTAYTGGPLEIQTANPRVGFHWPAVIASQIGMDSAGTIRTFDNPGTGYAAFASASIYTSTTGNNLGDLTVRGATNFQGGLAGTGTISFTYAHLHIGHYFYPGNIAAPGPVQSTWFLSSHSSYGLYTNTGLYCVGDVWASGISVTTRITPQYGAIGMQYGSVIATHASLTQVAAPAGGTGTAAGGWSTAANRDLAITSINAARNDIINIKQVLGHVINGLKLMGLLVP